MFKSHITTLAIVVVAGASLSANAADVQWGGPKQDFKFKANGLADRWPESGPKTLWKRDIGEGYSGILADGDRLYTMYRFDGKEVVICLNAKNGKTNWEYAYDAPISKDHAHAFNDGPRGTPTIYRDHLYTVGCSGILTCIDPADGKKKWQHDLWKEMDGSFLNHGYSSSPFGYENTIIVPVGGEGHSLVAFDRKTGDVKWQKQDFANSYSTPKLINVDGQDQLLCYMAQELVSVNPKDGAFLWKYEIGNQWNQNITLPVWGNDNILFISTNGAGSRGLKLTQKDGKTTVDELWSSRKPGVHHSNAVRVGNTVYTSTGGRGPGVFWAVDVKTGDVKWQERGFDKATFIYADGRFIILDENGNLGLATATPEFFQIHSKAQVLTPEGQSKSWTLPAISGTTLYVRDSEEIKALDLSAAG